MKEIFCLTPGNYRGRFAERDGVLGLARLRLGIASAPSRLSRGLTQSDSVLRLTKVGITLSPGHHCGGLAMFDGVWRRAEYNITLLLAPCNYGRRLSKVKGIFRLASLCLALAPRRLSRWLAQRDGVLWLSENNTALLPPGYNSGWLAIADVIGLRLVVALAPRDLSGRLSKLNRVFWFAIVDVALPPSYYSGWRAISNVIRLRLVPLAPGDDSAWFSKGDGIRWLAEVSVAFTPSGLSVWWTKADGVRWLADREPLCLCMVSTTERG